MLAIRSGLSRAEPVFNVCYSETVELTMHEKKTQKRLICQSDMDKSDPIACTLSPSASCHCILNVIQSGIIVNNADGYIISCNEKALQILGINSEIQEKLIEDLGLIFWDEAGVRIEPDDFPVNRAIFQKIPVSDIVVKFYRQPTDTPCWIRVNAFPFLKDEKVEMVVLNFVDITPEMARISRLKEREEQLVLAANFESEECFRAIFENATIGIVIMTPELKIVNANQTMENILGFMVDELKTLKLWDISFPDDYEKDRELLQDVLEGKRQYYQFEKRYVCHNGAMIWGMLTASSVRDKSGAPRFIVNMIEDISASKFAQEQLHYLNSHDSMTNLRNRAWFDEMFNRMQFGIHLPVSIIIMDLDGLKQINDSKGHEAGDSLIIGAATVLREAFPGQDIAARIGGDEFGVLLPEVSEEGALAVLERIRECQTSFNERSGQPPISFSLGTATAHSVEHLANIWKVADDCMYREKALHKRAKENSREL